MTHAHTDHRDAELPSLLGKDNRKAPPAGQKADGRRELSITSLARRRKVAKDLCVFARDYSLDSALDLAILDLPSFILDPHAAFSSSSVMPSCRLMRRRSRRISGSRSNVMRMRFCSRSGVAGAPNMRRPGGTSLVTPA